MIDILIDQGFGAGLGGEPCLDTNWAAAEADFTWSLGTESCLTLPLPAASFNLVLELDIQPLVGLPSLPAQTLAVSANAMQLGIYRLEGRQTLSLTIPDACLAGATSLMLRLGCPHAAIPASLGLGQDTRRLGIRLYRALLLHVPPEPAHAPASGADTLELSLQFGWGGNGNAHVLDGWSGPEHDYVWALGRTSRLRVPVVQPDAAHTILLDLFPIQDARLACQRIMLGANGRLLATLAVTTRTMLAIHLPPLEAGTTSLLLSFDNLDAAADRDFALYADGRPFVFMLLGLYLIRRADPSMAAPMALGPLSGADVPAQAEARSGLAPAQLAANFDTLGHGCMLAQFQLNHDVDRITLLRFIGVDAVALTRGLMNGFHLLGRTDRIETFTFGDDTRLWVRETTHRLRWRSPWELGATIAPVSIARTMARRLWFLRRRFLEDLGKVEKIYVFFLQPTTRLEAEAVAAALRLHGPHTMLWLVQDGSVPPGAVLWLGPGLLVGGVDRQGHSAIVSDDVWWSVMANAWAITRQTQPCAAPDRDRPAC